MDGTFTVPSRLGYHPRHPRAAPDRRVEGPPMNLPARAPHLLRVVLSCFALTSVVHAATAPRRSTSADRQALALTVYSQDLGLVQETRELELATGVQEVEFGDVAEQIDPTSVILASEGIRLLEQRFDHDPLTRQALLNRFVGRTLRLVTIDERGEHSTEATLLAATGEPIYRIGTETWLGHPGQVVLPALPDGMREHPALLWSLEAGRGGKQRVQTSYLTGGIGWSADYVLHLDREETTGNLAAWATIRNESGAGYRDARLNLVAGDLHRASPAPRPETMRVSASVEAMPAFASEALGEYHLYTLERPATIASHETVQLALLSASGATVRKRLILEGNPQGYYAAMNAADLGLKPEVRLEIANDSKNQMGIPLPAGRVRVYLEDASGSPQLVGEDNLPHTPPGGTLRLTLGRAFDVEADRTQTDFKAVAGGRYDLEVGFRIELRNGGARAATVTLREPIPGDWKLLESTPAGRKADAQTLEFDVPVPPGGSASVAYRVAVDVR